MQRMLRAVGAILILVASLGTSHADQADAAERAYSEGVELLRQKQYAEAVSALERSIELRPDDTRAWSRLGSARNKLGDHEGAVRAYRRLLELDPASARGWHNLGNVHYRQSNWSAAAEAYARALELDPDYLLAVYHHGRVLRELNRGDEARQAFEHCLEIPVEGGGGRKTRLDCRFFLGTLQFRAGQWAPAAGAMEQVLTAFPAHPEARYYLGMAYRRLGRNEDAREQLEIHQRLLAARRDEQPIARQPGPRDE